MTGRAVTAALALTLLAAACSSDDDADADEPVGTAASATADRADVATSATAPERAPAATAPAGDTVAPDAGTGPTPPSLTAAIEVALDDVLHWLAEPATAAEDRFSAGFLAEAPITDVRAGLATLGGGDWTISDVQPLTDAAVVATVQGPNQALSLQLEVDDDGRIDTLFFENAGLIDPPATIDDLLTRLAAAGEQTGFVRAEIADDGACQVVDEQRPDDVLPIASTFKLYVLGALADAVAAGAVAWDQPVAIRDELDSPGGGVTQDEPAGSTATVQELALRMISVSDNTATDHLIDLLGRDAVEEGLAGYGHHDPAVTVPILTTREMSVLKTDADLLARYEAADEAGRRSLLADEVAVAPTPSLDDQWPEPRAVTTVEWFASPLDLCRVLVGLDDASREPGLEPLTEILATNPGFGYDPARYSTLLFKGGSEPGVLVGAWLGRRIDGTRVVVAGGAASTGNPIDPSVIELVANGLVVP